MKTPTTKQPTSKKPAERKHPDGVSNQLSRIAPKLEAPKPAIAKARRVFAKAGCPDPTDTEVKQYLTALATLGQKSSRSLAKSIRDSK